VKQTPNVTETLLADVSPRVRLPRLLVTFCAAISMEELTESADKYISVTALRDGIRTTNLPHSAIKLCDRHAL